MYPVVVDSVLVFLSFIGQIQLIYDFNLLVTPNYRKKLLCECIIILRVYQSRKVQRNQIQTVQHSGKDGRQETSNRSVLV